MYNVNKSKADTALMKVGARYYDPTIGRWIQKDPILDGFNWWLYCGNDPVNGVDPEGTWVFTRTNTFHEESCWYKVGEVWIDGKLYEIWEQTVVDGYWEITIEVLENISVELSSKKPYIYFHATLFKMTRKRHVTSIKKNRKLIPVSREFWYAPYFGK